MELSELLMMESSTPDKTLMPIERLGSKRLTAECVLFDLDGTLYSSPEYSARIESEIVMIVAEEMQIDASLAWRRLSEERKKQGTLTGALSILGVDRRFFFEALAERVEPMKYLTQDHSVIATLETLKERGFKLALVTNNGRSMVRKILNAIGVEASLFDVMVTSDDCEPKPSRQPFLSALNRLECTPDKAVYVGDRVEAELLPAQELGIRTILLAKEGADNEADLVITRVTEVLSLVDYEGIRQ
jgi:HAD superfamily hydrolase (TIGR01549 family)